MPDAWKIARYELIYWLNRPVTVWLGLLLLGQGVGYGVWMAQAPEAGQWLVGSAPYIYYVLASAGMGLTTAVALMAGHSLARDVEWRTESYLYSLPLPASSFLLGRLAGTLLTVVGLGVFYPLGVGLVPFLFPHLGGATDWLALAQGYGALTVGQVVTVASVAFWLTIRLGGMAGAYLTMVGCLLYYLLTDVALLNRETNDFLLFLDPFGVGLIRNALPTGPAEATRNAAPDSIAWPAEWFINRLLWVGMSLLLFDRADKQFSYAWFRPSATPRFRWPARLSRWPFRRPAIGYPFRRPATRFVTPRRVGRLTTFEVGEWRRQPLVWSVAAALVALTWLTGTLLTPSPNVDQLATTASITALRYPMGALISLFLMLLTGEVVYREKTLGLALIYESLPQPAGLRLLAKVLALSLLAGLLLAVVALAGLVLQLGSGFPRHAIEWGLYVRDFGLDAWGQQVQLVALSLFLVSWAGQRAWGQVLAVGGWLVVYGGVYLGWSPWLLYSVLPGAGQYSDLTGYGIFTNWRPLLGAMWWGLAGGFFGLGVAGWYGGIPGASGRWRAVRTVWQNRWSGPVVGVGLGVYGLFLGLSGWVAGRPAEPVLPAYQTRTVQFQGESGPLTLSVRYVHPYQVGKLLQTARAALTRGERLFGAYPFRQLLIDEIPRTARSSVPSGRGTIRLAEQEGWTARPDSTRLDHLDYLVTREVLGQWLGQHWRVAPVPGRGLLQVSLAEYLALRVVGERYGNQRLAERLRQRGEAYRRARGQRRPPEPTLMQTQNEVYLTRWRAGMVLSSIGQVWGDSVFTQAISQFYRRRQGGGQPVTARDFETYLSQQLPDTLRYLTTYLNHRFTFAFQVGRLQLYPTDVSVAAFGQKWDQDNQGQHRALLPNDWVPAVLLDSTGRERYRRLIQPAPDQKPYLFPHIEGTHQVIIDPLGAWPTDDPRRSRKLF